MKQFIFVAILLIRGLRAYSQSMLTGVVIDAEDNKPVQYVSIGLTGTPNGTVSNTTGLFSITIDNKISNDDTLRFSSIGYKTEAFQIGQLKEKLKDGPLTISLKRTINQLQQVTIVSKKAKIKTVGYEVNSKLFGLGFGSSGVGSQGGVIIPINHPETNLQSLSFFIIKNPFTLLLFRINLYELVNGKPGDNILNENIFIKIENKQTGKMTFDLTKYNLYLNKDALITLEWIEAQPTTNDNLAVGASIFGHTYFQQASQYAWSKKGVGLGLSVKTNY